MAITKKQERFNNILNKLEETYRGIGSALEFNSTYQLLIAVMLSAQTNDNQVNKITQELYKDYGTPQKMAELSVGEIEEYIKTCGLYKNKAKNVFATTIILLEEYGGEVPSTLEELIKLPGVGKKTANVVMSVGFGKPALAVDTHVFRVAHRLEFSEGKNPDLVEKDLCKIIPMDKWADAHHWFIWHGRKICTARKPKCEECPVNLWCKKNI